MMTNVKTVPIKYKILKPLLIYFSILSVFIFILINSLLYSFLSKIQDYSYFNTDILIANALLLAIFILFMTILIVLTLRISNSISSSISSLSNDTKKLAVSTYRTETIKSFSCTEIQELNISIHKLAKKLLDYHTSQKTAFANASHELRTPLMSIQGYAEGIKYNVFEDINEPLDIIIEESKHLRDLIKGLLKLSQLDSQNLKINYEKINVYSTLNNFANKLRGLAYKNSKTISINGDKNIFVNTDEKLLSQAVTNILSNALRYAQEEIIISFESTIDNLIIHIQDDGSGISSNDLENLFTRFYKGDQGNFGLGLSIAQSSVKYLEGEITAFNTNTGACFDIKLPI